MVDGEFSPTVKPDRPEFAVLRADTALRDAPLAESRAVRDPLARADGPPFWVRVVGRRGSYLAVSPHDPQLARHEHCADPLAALQGLDVALWVPASAAMAVIGRPKAVRYPDGTGYALRPGLPVGERLGDTADGKQLRPLQTDDFVTAIAAAPADIGAAYVPADIADPATETAWLKSSARLRLGDGELLRRDSRNWLGGQVAGRAGADVLIEIAQRCAVFVAAVAESGIDRGGALGLLGGLAGAKPRALSLAAGTPVFWPDDRRAGSTVAVVTLGRELPAARGRRCFALPLRTWWPAGRAPASDGIGPHELAICVAAVDVQIR